MKSCGWGKYRGRIGSSLLDTSEIFICYSSGDDNRKLDISLEPGREAWTDDVNLAVIGT